MNFVAQHSRSHFSLLEGAQPLSDPYSQARVQITTLCVAAGFYELRALQRVAGERGMLPRGSFWLPVTWQNTQLQIGQLDKALLWAHNHAAKKHEIFIGPN